MNTRRSLRTSVAAIAAAGSCLLVGSPGTSAAPQPAGPSVQRLYWVHVDTATGEQYRALAAVNRRVAWVAGEEGGVLRTTDGGQHWRDVAPPRSGKLVFRDIEARSARRASVLAIGTGTDSRIYTTLDGGRHWAKAFVNHAPKAFYDCMDFWPGGRHGLAVSDPVGGKFRILSTRDGGLTWQVLSDRGMPRAVDGEFGFAASGTCLVAAGHRQAWLGSGGAAARVFHTRDRGRHWTVTDSPIPAADAGGVFSLAFRNTSRGMAVGGDFTAPDDPAVSGITRTGGRQWIAGDRTHGYRSGVAFVRGRPGVLFAVGPSGSDISTDGGRRWRHFGRTPYDGVQCARDGSCWASGPGGAVGRLIVR